MRKGDTILFEAPPSAVAYAAVGGKKEAEGPLADAFDMLIADTLCGEKTWEKAESDFARYCLEAALKKGRLQADALDAVFAGDLQCQCTASAYTMRGFDTPYLGLYGACSTMAEGFGLAACMVAGGHMQYAAAMSSSHFCAAERQFRTPLDYGGKRTPTAQWTVTGAGAAILAPAGGPPYVRAVTFGRVRDYNVTDINNMGAAMAPAACETILRYFADTGEKPEHFDAIFTGDLGFVGRTLLLQLLKEEGLPLENHQDCGLLVYDRDAQNVQAGGSGGSVLPRAARAARGPHEARAVPLHRRADEPNYVFTGREHPGRRPSDRAFFRIAGGNGKRRRRAMNFVWAFLVGGLICVVGQLLIDLTKLTPARILVLYVVAGVVLSALGWYDPLVDFAGAGATVPLIGFGHLLAQGVMDSVAQSGLVGALTGGFTAAAGGVTASLTAGFLAALLGKSRDQS